MQKLKSIRMHSWNNRHDFFVEYFISIESSFRVSWVSASSLFTDAGETAEMDSETFHGIRQSDEEVFTLDNERERLCNLTRVCEYDTIRINSLSLGMLKIQILKGKREKSDSSG